MWIGVDPLTASQCDSPEHGLMRSSQGRARALRGWRSVVSVCMTVLIACEAGGQTAGGSLDVPQTRLTPLGGPVAPTGAGVGQTYAAPPTHSIPPPQFDPYAGAPASGYISPATPSATIPPGGFFAPATPPAASYGTPAYGGLANQPPPLFGNGGGLFGGVSPLGGSPTVIPPSGYAGPGFAGSAYASPPAYGYPQSTYPQTAFPNSAPSTLFPGGLLGATPTYSPAFDPYRLIQRGRFRHAFIYDDKDPNALEINDTDFALAFAFPRFFFSNEPLYVAPSFSLHQWDGPRADTGADLPANAYSAFLGLAWQSDPNQIVGAEIAMDVGVFSEFDVMRSDSLRIRGKGLGTFRLTPASTFKLGVYYYDRVDVKLLPAGGIFWRPNPFTKVDIFFPQPKFSRFVSTVGTQDVWWYIAGDYGGGSWTIDRDDGRADQVDINDIRLMLGFEWGQSDRIRAGLRTWFFEFGYVADRELVYRYNGQDNLSLDDTWMVRLGVGY